MAEQEKNFSREIKLGVIIIGSLLWDMSDDRTQWRRTLKMGDKIKVPLPIRYGRFSASVARQNTYTMVFSNHLTPSVKKLGIGYVVPIQSKVQSSTDLKEQILAMSKAEGIDATRICRSWGTVAISVNPFIEETVKNEINEFWTNLVQETVANLNRNQRSPTINDFGDHIEIKSIDANWKLTIDLIKLFKNELRNFDVLIATANAVKLNEAGENKYPTELEIATAIFNNNYYEYFLRNRQCKISTFQDKKIVKILKNRFKISLKKKRRLLN